MFKGRGFSLVLFICSSCLVFGRTHTLVYGQKAGSLMLLQCEDSCCLESEGQIPGLNTKSSVDFSYPVVHGIDVIDFLSKSILDNFASVHSKKCKKVRLHSLRFRRMVPLGHPAPIGGAQSVHPSLLGSSPGSLGAQGGSLSNQNAFSSLMSPCGQFDNEYVQCISST